LTILNLTLMKKIDLEKVSEAVHYSKYHLHRMFTNTVGMTIHDYVQRRQLTEAAKLLVFSSKPIIDTEIDGVVGMNSGIFNNPFMIWGRYRRKAFRYYLPVSFQFHHTQMDGAHAGRFLRNLQDEINRL